MSFFINWRHPWDITSHTFRRGNLVLLCIFVFFFAHRRFFILRPRVFSRALGSGACREPARTPRRRCGPGRGPWHVLWGFKVASNHGEAFRARSAIQAHANPCTGLKKGQWSKGGILPSFLVKRGYKPNTAVGGARTCPRLPQIQS